MRAMSGFATHSGGVDDVALLERSAFADALGESLAGVAAGGGRLVLVSGEAGIGKSALVRGFCAAHATRARVPLGCLRCARHAAAARPLDRHRGGGGGPAARVACARATSRTRSSLALLEELSAVRPTIAVIEDVHWADEATLDIVRLLARRAEALGALVVVTYREDELEPTHPAAARRGRARHGAGHRAAAAAAALARGRRGARRARAASTPRSSTSAPPAIRSSSPRCSRAAAPTCRRRCAMRCWRA